MSTAAFSVCLLIAILIVALVMCLTANDDDDFDNFA
jgi:hypothetical protein